VLNISCGVLNMPILCLIYHILCFIADTVLNISCTVLNISPTVLTISHTVLNISLTVFNISRSVFNIWRSVLNISHTYVKWQLRIEYLTAYCLHSEGCFLSVKKVLALRIIDSHCYHRGLTGDRSFDEVLQVGQRHSLDFCVKVRAASLSSCFIVAARITPPPSPCAELSALKMMFSLE
jgi:hypothetical protein